MIMTPQKELDGCKILKRVGWIGFTIKNNREVEYILYNISRKKINLLFVSYIKKGKGYINIGVKPESISDVIREIKVYTEDPIVNPDCAVLSLFPHKNDPQIAGALLNIYSDNRPQEFLFVNSFSSISLAFPNNILEQVIKFLFNQFHFKRPVEDWTRVYRENKNICKEVIASYQEKRPKVYFLEYRDNQTLISLELSNKSHLRYLNQLFKELDKDSHVTFLASSPKRDGSILFLSIYPDKPNLEGYVEKIDNMVVFSMNGPHFGDRYGIAMLLFKAMNEADIDFIGLNCSTHSIVGMIPQNHLERAIDSMKRYFEIPSVIKRN